MAIPDFQSVMRPVLATVQDARALPDSSWYPGSWSLICGVFRLRIIIRLFLFQVLQGLNEIGRVYLRQASA